MLKMTVIQLIEKSLLKVELQIYNFVQRVIFNFISLNGCNELCVYRGFVSAAM